MSGHEDALLFLLSGVLNLWVARILADWWRAIRKGLARRGDDK